MAVKNIFALRGSFITGNYPFIAVHLLQSRGGHVKPLALKNETATPATNHLKLGPLDEGLLRTATRETSLLGQPKFKWATPTLISPFFSIRRIHAIAHYFKLVIWLSLITDDPISAKIECSLKSVFPWMQNREPPPRHPSLPLPLSPSLSISLSLDISR